MSLNTRLASLSLFSAFKISNDFLKSYIFSSVALIFELIYSMTALLLEAKSLCFF